jgi:predicted nucleotidyltransferase
MMINEMDIRWIAERVVALCDPESVRLCGSYATGAAHAGSDIDLMIVMPSAVPRWHRGKVLRHALSTFPCRFDLLIFTPEEVAEELKDPYSFISAITFSGQLVYSREQGHIPFKREAREAGPPAQPVSSSGCGWEAATCMEDLSRTCTQ